MCDVGFWSDVLSAVIGAGVGAFLAFELERRRRNDELRRGEVSRCHQFACLLANRLNVLQNFHEGLFLNFENEHGAPPTWDQVAAFDGAPRQIDEIPIGDYTFLIDGRTHDSDAPALLRKVQISTINTNALFDRIARRNLLWHEREDLLAQFTLTVGVEGAQARGRVMALERSLADLTAWVWKDLEEEIATLNEIFDVFYQVMREHYPKEKILHFKPKEGGAPLGLAGGAASQPDA